MMFVSCMWLIDLGCSALAMDSDGLYAQTLLATWTPNQIYHIGLIGGMLVFYLVICFLVYEYFIKERENEYN